jgi:hypothetical protein
MPAQKSTRRLLPDAKVCERYGIHVSTLNNWDHNPALRFPGPIRINKRKYRDEEELDAFDQARAAERETAANPKSQAETAGKPRSARDAGTDEATSQESPSGAPRPAPSGLAATGTETAGT